jgi:hypothetical protein
LKKTESRHELDWSLHEEQTFKLAQEILLEVDLAPTHSEKPYHSRLVYVWALIFERRAVWKLQVLLADALKRYADTL